MSDNRPSNPMPLPCPHCGAQVSTDHIPPHKHVIATFMPDAVFDTFVIECACGAGMCGHETMNEVVERWNKRAQSEPSAERRAQYWKDEALAANDEINRLELEITRITRGDVSNVITTLGDALTYIGQLERARTAQPPSAGAPTVARLDFMFDGDVQSVEIRKHEWVAAKRELIAARHGMTAEQVSNARESLIDAVVERVRLAEPPSAITPDVLLLLNEAQNVVIDQAGMSGNTPERRAYLDGIAERLEHLIDSHASTKGDSRGV